MVFPGTALDFIGLKVRRCHHVNAIYKTEVWFGYCDQWIPEGRVVKALNIEIAVRGVNQSHFFPLIHL